MQPTKEFLLSPRVLTSVYNTIANVFWSLLAFAPVSVFCYRFMGRPWLLTFVVVSLLPLMLPTSTLSFLELSSTVRTYRNLGVHWVNHFVQHGTLINNLLRHKDPEYKHMRYRTRAAGLCIALTCRSGFTGQCCCFFFWRVSMRSLISNWAGHC